MTAEPSGARSRTLFAPRMETHTEGRLQLDEVAVTAVRNGVRSQTLTPPSMATRTEGQLQLDEVVDRSAHMLRRYCLPIP